jgi:hypothetical protein
MTSPAFQREPSRSVTVELAQKKSDVLVETALYNALFMDRYLYNTYFRNEVPNTSIDSLHETTIGTSLYQLYYGTLKLSGCKKFHQSARASSR